MHQNQVSTTRVETHSGFNASSEEKTRDTSYSINRHMTSITHLPLVIDHPDPSPLHHPTTLS
jgi:hypothetical protein